jgi:predicted Zn-dependent peptidase
MAHFVEHLLFKGTPRRPNPKILIETIEGVGGMIDAYTNVESTVYSVKVAHIHLERAIDVLADMLQHPNMSVVDVDKERRVILEEISTTADTPSELVHLLADTAMWGAQPLGRDIAGSEATVSGFQRDALYAFYQNAYTRANLVISVAGNVDSAQVLALITAAFVDMPTGTASVIRATQPALTGPNVTVQFDDSEQVHFCISLLGLGMDDPDRWAMLAFDSVVGGNSTSRLFQEIREERALAYTIGSYSREFRDAGKWVVSASVDTDTIDETVTAVMNVLRDVKANGLTQEELAQIKEQVKGGMLLSLEDTMSVASRNGSHMLRYGRIISVEDVISSVEALTLADITRVALRVLQPDNLHLTMIGPVTDTATVAKQLHL